MTVFTDYLNFQWKLVYRITMNGAFFLDSMTFNFFLLLFINIVYEILGISGYYGGSF